jgi:hypothetical protein
MVAPSPGSLKGTGFRPYIKNRALKGTGFSPYTKSQNLSGL